MDRLASTEHAGLENLNENTRKLRGDRGVAFDDSEFLTPSEFYSEKDAPDALDLLPRYYLEPDRGLMRRIVN